MARALQRTARVVELSAKVAFLKCPQAYADGCSQVEAIETHLSWVFLTDRYAYKLKKPACSRQVDYSSLAARAHFCREEVRLNRRLALDVYLGTAPLLLGARGLRTLGRPGDASPPGEAVDWLVVMRRLPREQMLDRQIARGTLDTHDLTAAVALLTGFYERAERVGWSGETYRLRLERDVRRYRQELDAPRFDLDDGPLDRITAAQLALLGREPELFRVRAEAGHVVDGHGDLRPEHVLLGRAPRIIDCLEFDRELRLLDSASELAFLTLECARLGAPELRPSIRETYAELSGDRPAARLLDFYESHHACIRAAVALWHLDDPTQDARSKWVQKARSYLRLAAGRIQELDAA